MGYIHVNKASSTVQEVPKWNSLQKILLLVIHFHINHINYETYFPYCKTIRHQETYQNILLCYTADILKITDDESNQVSAHLNTGFKVILHQVILVCCCRKQRHIEKCYMMFLSDQRHGEVGLHVWLIKARECRSGICGLKMCGGNISVKYKELL